MTSPKRTQSLPTNTRAQLQQHINSSFVGEAIMHSLRFNREFKATHNQTIHVCKLGILHAYKCANHICQTESENNCIISNGVSRLSHNFFTLS